MLRSLWLGVGLLAAGCGSGEGGPDPEPDEPAPVCEAGRVVDCPCLDGTTGAQACDDDGDKWGACACASDSKPGSAEPQIVTADEVCAPSPETDRQCEISGGAWGALYPKAYINCVVPDGAELIHCVVFPGSACCY